MRYTFGQAKQSLSRYASAYGLVDVGATINTAIDELSRSRVWQRLRKVVRFTVTDEYFSLPQDCGAIVRAAVDSVPVSVHGLEYEFLHSGPGDLDFQEAGLAPLNGIQRVGVYPTMYDMPAALPLAAFTTVLPTGALRVRGKNANGDRVIVDVPVTQWAGPDDAAGLDPTTVTKSAESIAEIDSITLPNDASAYISLFSVGDELSNIARMHPKQTIPEFTRYRLPGFSATEGTTYRVLAEVALRFVPLAEDDEVLPFDSILPVQFMMQSMWAMEAGEVKAADDYRQRAEMLLMRREESELERQTLIVVNRIYDGSAGQASDNWANI